MVYLSYYHEFQDVDMSSGDWYVLARTRYMLNELENVLYSKGSILSKQI